MTLAAGQGWEHGELISVRYRRLHPGMHPVHRNQRPRRKAVRSGYGRAKVPQHVVHRSAWWNRDIEGITAGEIGIAGKEQYPYGHHGIR
jgi:hypothetical protein